MTDIIANIRGKEDLIRFLRLLAQDCAENPQEWQNLTVQEYLEAAASWTEDFSVCPRNDIDWDTPDYQTIAKIFYMGKLYE